MRTPRTKTGVNNENNTSKCPHKPRTKPLMLICRPGVPSLLPPPSAAGQWPDSKHKISSRKGILQVCCSLHGAAVDLGEKKNPGSAGTSAAISAPLSHISGSITPCQAALEAWTTGPSGVGQRALLVLGSCVSLAESFN